jgi:hypothetical protein
MLYCMYIIIKRDYPALRVSVINCEIRIVIYTFFKLFGNESYKEGVLGKGGVDSTYKV